jgi:hypothetical protein
VGRRAGEAAQAVRCAGLKPGLERCFFSGTGHSFGTVVRQDPAPGSELARNGLVVLYVAAPGEAEESSPSASENQAPPADARGKPEPASTRAPSARRRRKAKLAGRAETSFSPPPLPTPRVPETQSAESPAHAEVSGPRVVAQEPQWESNELGAEELVIHAGDVFGDATGLSSYRGRFELRATLSRHSRFVAGVLGLLAVWLVVGVFAALGHQDAPTHGTARPIAKSVAHQVAASPIPRPPGKRRRRTTARSWHRRRKRTHHAALRPSSKLAHEADASAPVRPPTTAAPPARAASQGRSKGGQFSP